MPRRKLIPDEVVLDAARQVLLERGPHGFRLTDVSKKAGIAPATLIQRFGTRQALIRATAKRSAEQAAVREPVSDEPPLKVLVRLLLKRAEPFAERKAFSNGIALMLEDLRDEPLRAAAARKSFATELVIERLLDDAGYRHPEKAARVVYAAWNGALMQWAVRGEGTLERYLRRVLGDALGLLRR